MFHTNIKFHLGARIRGLGLDKASSLTVNLVSEVEFYYTTLVIMNYSIKVEGYVVTTCLTSV